MAKKLKNKVTKKAKKAMSAMGKRGPLTAAIVALGGFASAILTSQKVRDGVEQLITSAFARATRALGQMKAEAGDAIKSLQEPREHGDSDEGERAGAH